MLREFRSAPSLFDMQPCQPMSEVIAIKSFMAIWLRCDSSKSAQAVLKSAIRYALYLCNVHRMRICEILCYAQILQLLKSKHAVKIRLKNFAKIASS